jgi:hypothetical protein
MLPMHKKEFEKWTEVRMLGGKKYAIKTSFTATILVFLLYFVTNGFLNLDNIDKYIAYNISDADSIFIGLAFTFLILLAASRILFSVNEKRYINTQIETQQSQQQ